MQLRRVRVQNIRSYESADVAFPAGTTLVAGDVGSGKTSLLYAIEMALFGIAEIDASYLVRHGASRAEAEVEFEDPEHRYAIRRVFRRVHRRGKPSFEPERISFRVDGAETAYSATELRQRVIELLGFPDNPNPQAHSDLWRWAVYVPQERMRDILAARPQDRLETVRKALGVERYRTAADNAQDVATDLRRTAATRRAEADRLQHYDREHADWQARSDQFHLDRARATEELARREAELAAAQSARSSAEGDVRATETARTVLSSLRHEDDADARAQQERSRLRAERAADLERVGSDIQVLDRDAADQENRRRARDEAAGERSRQRELLDGIERRLRQLAEQRAGRAAARRALEEARSALERSESHRRDLERSSESARTDGPAHAPPAPTPLSLAVLDERLTVARDAEQKAIRVRATAERSLSEITELLSAGTCPRCGQAVRPEEFGAHRSEAEAADRAAEAGFEAARQARAQLDEARRARERYERAFEKWTEVEKRRHIARAAVDRAAAEAVEASERVRSAEQSLHEAEQRIASFGALEEEEGVVRAELARREAALDDAGRRLESAIRAQDRRLVAVASVEALRLEVERIDQELRLVEVRRAERNERIAPLLASLAGAEERGERLRATQRRVAVADEALTAERKILVRVDAGLDEAARRIEEAERGRAERSQLLSEAEELARTATWLAGPFREAVLEMEKLLLVHAQAAFQRHFARYFASLVDDPSLLARTDAAFTPAVTIEDEWTPAEALSGGERTSLALAFRLALAQVVRTMGHVRLETLLLDEPTDGFSPEQVVRMGDLLEEIALPQVILVSHEAELAAIADRVVRIEKRSGRSWPSTDAGPRSPPEGTASEFAAEAPPPRRSGRGTRRSPRLE
jgi:DNA repair protein SbcC/Rad50